MSSVSKVSVGGARFSHIRSKSLAGSCLAVRAGCGVLGRARICRRGGPRLSVSGLNRLVSGSALAASARSLRPARCVRTFSTARAQALAAARACSGAAATACSGAGATACSGAAAPQLATGPGPRFGLPGWVHCVAKRRGAALPRSNPSIARYDARSPAPSCWCPEPPSTGSSLRRTRYNAWHALSCPSYLLTGSAPSSLREACAVKRVCRVGGDMWRCGHARGSRGQPAAARPPPASGRFIHPFNEMQAYDKIEPGVKSYTGPRLEFWCAHSKVPSDRPRN